MPASAVGTIASYTIRHKRHTNTGENMHFQISCEHVMIVLTWRREMARR